jgi:hypothetical protein
MRHLSLVGRFVFCIFKSSFGLSIPSLFKLSGVPVVVAIDERKKIIYCTGVVQSIFHLSSTPASGTTGTAVGRCMIIPSSIGQLSTTVAAIHNVQLYSSTY